MRREICVSKSIRLACSGKFTIFALFYFVFEGKFQVQAPWGAYIRRGDLTEGFLRYDFGGLIHGGAYYFSEFYGIFLLFEILLYLESYSVFFLDRLLEYIHGVLCYCFFGYKKICFHLLFRSKQGLPSETTCSFSV